MRAMGEPSDDNPTEPFGSPTATPPGSSGSPSPQPPPPWQVSPAPAVSGHRSRGGPDHGVDDDERVWVRPYVRTRGRTRVRTDLALETLVSLPTPRPVLVDTEHRSIAAICVSPLSVAEVAARLRVPLGVARVLIDDMHHAGLLRVHPRSVAGSGTPERAMMLRVLDGLNRL